jgi:hypothetical protein
MTNDQVQAPQVEIPEAEIAEAGAKGISADAYTYARDAGESHAEALESQRARMDVGEYTNARKAHATHGGILETGEVPVELGDLDVIKISAKYRQVIRADRAGLNGEKYACAREIDNMDHDEAMDELTSNLNPGHPVVGL